jgi:signal transduction histidine kinase
MTRETTVRGDPSPLADQVERQNRELKTLLEIAQNLTLALDLETLLGVMLDQMKRVIDYEGATILVRRGDDLVPRAYRGPADPVAVMARHYRVDEPSSRRVLESRRPIIVHDMQTDEAIRAWMSPTARPLFDGPFRYIRGWMSAPLIYQEEAVGILVVHHTEPGAFSERQAGTAMAFASQAAVAVANARLYAQAQELAALQERHRLAYELHDSVSQALYGITLGAQTAWALRDQDPDRLAEALDYVLELSATALAEMRSLIFQLRPESLATEGLREALTKRADVLRTRYKLAVDLAPGLEPDAGLEAKQALLRVAQEATHNIVKHARATRVEIRLDQIGEWVELAISDDGQRFDPAGSFPDHLGLHSMRERVEALGGTLEITSHPGRGTRIVARLPAGLPSRLKPAADDAGKNADCR